MFNERLEINRQIAKIYVQIVEKGKLSATLFVPRIDLCEESLKKKKNARVHKRYDRLPKAFDKTHFFPRN